MLEAVALIVRQGECEKLKGERQNDRKHRDRRDFLVTGGEPAEKRRHLPDIEPGSGDQKPEQEGGGQRRAKQISPSLETMVASGFIFVQS